jgi:hypothetical protein
MQQNIFLFTDFVTPPSLKQEILNTSEAYCPSHHSLLTSTLHCSTRILSHIFLSDLRVFYMLTTKIGTEFPYHPQFLSDMRIEII